ncbi:hypothetical protein LOD99_6611 [Oopsacas minuta]|uniref:DDT domain-containing protein n=1 Tax=Oopsacas minuta TaxID=111878 RepID=A0AAV7JKW8_9METZ|nr:hypothetical protein LOD99_6611 [Oopsacas minuta]
MKQTTLFGITTPTKPTVLHNTNGNTNSKHTLQSPGNALSDYFKQSNTSKKVLNNRKNSEITPKVNRQSKNTAKHENKMSPVSQITDDISIISIDSPLASKNDQILTPLKAITLGINSCCMNNSTPEISIINTNKDTIQDCNRITSHFLPKKLHEKFVDSFEEDEKSLQKSKPKVQESEIFLKENLVEFDSFSDVLTVSEFLHDFHELLEVKSDENWSPPDFHTLYKALKSCDLTENFTILSTLLLRFMKYLFTESLPYFQEDVGDLNTACNVAALLRLYFQQKNECLFVQEMEKDLYCLPFNLKVSILIQLIYDVNSSTDFRSFYDKKCSQIEEIRRTIKILQGDIARFDREMVALKYYKKEKNQSLILDNTTQISECDKENIKTNANHQSTDEEDVDTRLQKVLGKFNHSQMEIAKLRASIEELENVVMSKKKLGTDTCGRNYFNLKSFSDTAILVELEYSKLQFLTSLNKTKSQHQGDRTNEPILSKILEECDSKNDQHFTGWMSFSTESELTSLVKYLRSTKCDKKIHSQIEELRSFLRNIKLPVVSPIVEESHYLRSTIKNKLPVDYFTVEEFARQLLEFGEELLYSGFVSTKFDCVGWIDALSNEDFSHTTEVIQELSNKLTSLIDSLIKSTTVNVPESITKCYMLLTPPTLSHLFLLLNYYEHTLSTVDSCYGNRCMKCYKKPIWNGKTYNPKFICKECSKVFHLTCQDPPLPDIVFDHRCDSCRNPQSLITNTFYRTRSQRISEDDSSSEPEEIVVRRKSLRQKPTFFHSFYSSPVRSQIEKKRRIIVSSESEDNSPYVRRKGLRSMTYQPPRKKIPVKPNDYTSKLRSACS